MPATSMSRTLCARLIFILLTAGAALPAAGQTTLGTIRGTVYDPQQNVVPGATVVVTDEETNVTRETQTDAQGQFEFPNLRSGTYTVSATLSGFKKVARAGVVLRAASVMRTDLNLEVGGLEDLVTVTAEGQNNITVESQSIARGLDEQQLRDLPRNSRDVQDFLTLNANIVGGFDSIQFLGGRTYGASYIQDGQPSSAGIFGELSNAAPGLDAIAEVQVLSNSYSAEYGGLAGVIVTSKRGGNRYHGSSFADYNSNELNARTYAQTLNGVSRDDPNADTHDYRYGVSLGGPLVSNRTFFFGNYEGSRLKALGGGSRAIVPTAAMRNGDFSANPFVVRDPNTGAPFPGNRIPPDRIDSAARRILEFFYPLPNQPTLAAGGYGDYRQILPLERTRDRGDGRIDHEVSRDDSVFARVSWQRRDPDAFTFESTGGNGGAGLTNLGLLDRRSTATTLAFGWTRIWSSALVNEFRAGYSEDVRNRRSRFVAGDVTSQLGLEVPPLAAQAPGFPSFLFSGTNRPSDIRDQRQNTFRDLDQSSFSASSTATWLRGAHSIKFGGIYTRNYAKDGYSTGANESKGAYALSGYATGNAFADLLLGLPNETREQRNTRGDMPMDTFSNDWALYAQDDWKLNSRLTLFLGLRYEVVGVFVDRNDIYANFVPLDDGHHLVPSAPIAELLPPGARQLDRTLTADRYGVGRALIGTDRNNVSPRAGFAQRLDDNKTVVRGGFGIFHPTGAAQGARDIMSRNPFRYTIRYRRGTLQQGFSSGTRSESLGFGNQGLDLDLELPDIYQYNLTLERELPGDLGGRVSYIGSTMRKLLVHRDYNTVQASAVPLGNVDEDPAARARLPFPLYGTFMDITENTGEGQFHALQLEVRRRFRNGFAVNVAYTLAGSDGNAPDSGNSTIGVVQYDPYDIEKDRGPDPNVVRHRVVMNGTWDVPVGRGRPFGSAMPAWADAIVGGWTVSTIFQARTGPNLTPYFTYGDTGGIYPANTGRALDGVGQFGEAWRPDVLGEPNTGGTRARFYDLTAFALPAPGTLGTAAKGSVRGPGTWIVNFAFYKDVFRSNGVSGEFTALLDNAFNHPQFSVGLGTGGFMDLTDYLINGVAENGTTAVLGADAVASPEGFSVGRVIRLGLRLRF